MDISGFVGRKEFGGVRNRDKFGKGPGGGGLLMCRIRAQSSRVTFLCLCICLIMGLLVENENFWRTKQVIMCKLDWLGAHS